MYNDVCDFSEQNVAPDSNERRLSASSVLAAATLSSCSRLGCEKTRAELLVSVGFVVLLDDECMASVLFGKARKEYRDFNEILIGVSNLGYESLIAAVRRYISLLMEFGGPWVDQLNEIRSALPEGGPLSREVCDD